MVAAAVIGAAVIGAAGATVAGSEAAGATKDATNASIAQQQSALSQQAALSQPYRDLGTSNIQTYQNLLTGAGSGSAPPGGSPGRTGVVGAGANGPGGSVGVGGGGAAPGSAQAGANIEQTLQNMPGYQATLNTGIEAAKRSSAASGLNLSGNQVTAVETYGAQLADSTYQQQLNNLLQPIQLGQAAAAGQAANVGTSASNISNSLIAQGNNMANIDANTIAGITKAGSSGVNQYMTYNTLQGLNNPSGGSSGANFDGSTLPPPSYGDPAMAAPYG